MSNLLSGWTFAFTIMNFFILYFILKRFLFKPVTNYMEKRTNSIKESFKKAEDANKAAESLRKEYENQLEMANETANKIIEEARKNARKEFDDIIKEAKLEAEAIKSKGDQEVSYKHEQMMKKLREEAASLVFAAAEKLIEVNLDEDKNRQLVERFLNDIDVA